MSLTDDKIRSLAKPLSVELWKDIGYYGYQAGSFYIEDKGDLTLLARLIYAEEKDPIGQANVAQTLHNKMRIWKLKGKAGTGIRYKDEPPWRYTWRGIVYNNGYSPINSPKLNSGGPLYPLGDPIDANKPIPNSWRNACELAYKLMNGSLYHDHLITEATVTDQVYYRGYDGRETLMEDIWKEYLASSNNPNERVYSYTEKNDKGEDVTYYRYQMVRGGNSLFFNDQNSRDIYISDYIDVPLTGQPNNTGIPDQTTSDFIEFLKAHVGCGYVLGTYGQICTQQLLQNRAVADPANGTDYYLGPCSRWIGKLVADCSGLIEWFLLKRGVTNCDSYSGGMYKNWCTVRSTNMSDFDPVPGTAVFKRNSSGNIVHVGIYVGNDRVIEAKGAMYGVVVSRFSADAGWNNWGWFDWLNADMDESQVGYLPIVSDALTHGPLPGYPDISSDPSQVVSHSGSYTGPLYKKGDTGSKIEMIRRRFWATSSNFVVNDFFDDVLENKIIEFQTANALTVDGKVGSQTWRKIFPILQKKTGSQFGAKEMQTLLNYQNYTVGTPDGLFGTGTENVLKAYQTARQLDPDGICGDKTWESLTLEEPFLNEVTIDQNGDSTAICSMGDSNNKVIQLQQRLAVQYNLNVTGVYDSATNACVIAFQTANGISANGCCGPKTWGKLFPVLRMGRGTRDEVKPLQYLLCYQKHGVLVDGVFGGGSDAAVKAYQTLRGLTSDGIVGEQTWASLTCTTPMSGPSLYFSTGGSGSGGGSGTSIYRLGDNNSAVRQIKRRMAAESLFSGTINTIFDLDLDYAVKSFQASQGTRIDGLVGTATWSLLFPIVKKQTGQQAGAKAVQTLLNLNGFSVGTPDGLFGSGSETKLIAFQTAKGLTPDGICGQLTWTKLCEI